MSETQKIELVLITGMSGAGKTVAIQSFEDLGFFTIDNLPPRLLPDLLDVVKKDPDLARLALVMDVRCRHFFRETPAILASLLDEEQLSLRILFLDASNEELIARYKETRRIHPLAGEQRLVEGIGLERDYLAELKQMSQDVIDTTVLTPRALRNRIREEFAPKGSQPPFRIEVVSFGFKYGLPADADLVFDVRFLPNPYYEEALRYQTGLDAPVYDYVMSSKEAKDFYQHLLGLLDLILPDYQKEGKSLLTIAIGCTGGRHRSVAFAKRLADELSSSKWAVHTSHRDKEKRKEKVNRS